MKCMAAAGIDLDQEEFDFVEPPPQDFFCPVTFELLLNPHQTTCCGNHLSEKAVDRLQCKGKPCPMCKEPQLVTVQDKFFKRMTNAVLIHCPHKANGCKWVGEVGKSEKHINACSKQPWNCQHCDFKSTLNARIQHMDECTKYPIPCPNKCEMIPSVGIMTSSSSPCGAQIHMIPRCDIEKHRAECPLETVACEFANVGCKVRTTRQELKRHMEESQQEHLLSATLLNLRLTRETIAEKDCQIAELQKQLAEKDHQIAVKDGQIFEKDQRLANTSESRSVATRNSQLLEALTQSQQRAFEFTWGSLQYSRYAFTLERFSECQRKVGCGDWFSDAFDVDSGKYRLKLNIETKERGRHHMTVRFYPENENSGGKTFTLALQMLNQLNNHDHFLRQWEATTGHGWNCSGTHDYVKFEELYKKDRNIQYLKDDCIKFVLWIKRK